jgi:hypothetical protein
LLGFTKFLYGYIDGVFKTCIRLDHWIWCFFIKQTVNRLCIKSVGFKACTKWKDPFTLMRYDWCEYFSIRKTLQQSIETAKKYFCVSTDKAQIIL